MYNTIKSSPHFNRILCNKIDGGCLQQITLDFDTVYYLELTGCFTKLIVYKIIRSIVNSVNKLIN